MKITNLEVSNFRNLKNININFWNINILTWKNSTWKTNFTQLLTNCLNVNDDIEKQFWKNILTYWPWVSDSYINVTINNIYYEMWRVLDEKIEFFKPESFLYKRNIIKNPLSIKKTSLDFIWKITKENPSQIEYFKEWESFKFFNKVKTQTLKDVYVNKNTNNIIKENNDLSYFRMFENIVKDKVITYDDSTSFSKCSWNIFNFVTLFNDVNKKEISLESLEILQNKDIKRWNSNFSTAKFIFLLADIQRNDKQLIKFNDDLDFFTDWILKEVYINKSGTDGSKWDIYIKSPNWPKNIELISAWTSIMLYFILLKNWLELDIKSYQNPEIMIFDELDSAIHPSLIWRFSDLLKIISHKVQLFITTHSPIFIDNFKKEDIYLLKDIWSFNEKVQVESNIMSYEKILESLSENEQEELKEVSNSELYINWYIDTFFPIIK
jgi:hypothetical protein